jgi:hypothetical protein
MHARVGPFMCPDTTVHVQLSRLAPKASKSQLKMMDSNPHTDTRHPTAVLYPRPDQPIFLATADARVSTVLPSEFYSSAHWAANFLHMLRILLLV